MTAGWKVCPATDISAIPRLEGEETDEGKAEQEWPSAARSGRVGCADEKR